MLPAVFPRPSEVFTITFNSYCLFSPLTNLNRGSHGNSKLAILGKILVSKDLRANIDSTTPAPATSYPILPL
jgi:hypothetical protein